MDKSDIMVFKLVSVSAALIFLGFVLSAINDVLAYTALISSSAPIVLAAAITIKQVMED